MPSVEEEGGVTVRRDGSGKLKLWNYGYRCPLQSRTAAMPRTETTPPPETPLLQPRVEYFLGVYVYDRVPRVNRADKFILLPDAALSSTLHEPLRTRGRYVVTFDGARRLSAGNALALSCAGSANDCGCIDVTGAISGPRAVGCGEAGSAEDITSTSAEFDSSACRVQAVVKLETLREGGETVVGGGGILSFSDGGQYFLPSAVAADVEVMSAAEVVCPQWAAELVGAVNISSGGMLWFAGDDGQKNGAGYRGQVGCGGCVIYGVSHMSPFTFLMPRPSFFRANSKKSS